MMEERLHKEEKQVALKDLKLDPHNVRFRHNTTLLTEKQMEEYLYDEEDVKLLIRQVLQDKKVQQPIYVIEDSGGKYTVKEGNRRTVALRRIDYDIKAGKIEGFTKNHFEVVPVFVLHGTKHEIDVFVAQDHVSGKNEWAALNKASVVYDFIDNHGESIQEVAVELGLTKSRVSNYYEAFKATEKYGKRYPSDKNYVTKFSYCMELYSSRVLKNWLSEDPVNLDYFIELVNKNKLEATYKGPRKLAKIIATPNPLRAKALAELDVEDGDIEKAFSILTEYKARSGGVWADVKKLRSIFDKTSYDEFVLAVDDPEKFDLLEEIIEKTIKMRDEIILLQTRKETA
jgi:hypothetical protein